MEMIQALIMVIMGSLRDHANLVRHAAYGPVRKEQADSIRRRVKFVITHIREIEEEYVTDTERRSEHMLEMMVGVEKVVEHFQKDDDDPELAKLLRDMQFLRQRVTPEIGDTETEMVLSVRSTFRQYREELEKILTTLDGL